jgi:hypothetical protein
MMAIRQVQVPWIRGLDIGVGADLASGSPMNLAVEPEASDVDQAGGALTDFRLRRIRETEDLERALGIDVEASYGCASFGAGVSARFSFAKETRIHSSSLFMAITSLVELGFLSIDAPRLTQPAKELTNHPDVFAARYGNMFVRGMSRGGLYVGVLRIDTRSEQESTEVSAALEGSYGAFSTEAEGKFRDVQSEYRSEVSVRMFREGGPIDLKINDPANPIELLTNANRFLESFVQSPAEMARPYMATLAPLTIAEGPLPPNESDMQKAQDVLVYCAKRRSALLNQLNLLDHISDNPTRFSFDNGSSLEDVRQCAAAIQEDLDTVAGCASAAINNVQSAMLPVEFSQARGEQYPKAKMPNPMPEPREAPNSVTVPDFTNCQTWNECVALAQRHQLNVTYEYLGDKPEGFTVIEVRPPVGTVHPIGSVVTIVCPPELTIDPDLLIDLFRTSRGLR